MVLSLSGRTGLAECAHVGAYLSLSLHVTVLCVQAGIFVGRKERERKRGGGNPIFADSALAVGRIDICLLHTLPGLMLLLLLMVAPPYSLPSPDNMPKCPRKARTHTYTLPTTMHTVSFFLSFSTRRVVCKEDALNASDMLLSLPFLLPVHFSTGGGVTLV